jgi:hypothetical protein
VIIQTLAFGLETKKVKIKFAFRLFVCYIVYRKLRKIMNKIKELRAKIGAFASALEKMNDEATPETALSVKVANEVFGEDLAEMQAELVKLESPHRFNQ